MLRVVLAVVLAGALLAATAPALENGRATATDRRMQGQLTAIRNTAAELARTNDPVPPGGNGARAVVTLTLPEGPAAASVEYVELGGDGGTTLAYALVGGPRHEIRVDGLGIGTVRGRDTARPRLEPLVLRRGGTHRIAFELVRLGGRPVVAFRRIDADV